MRFLASFWIAIALILSSFPAQAKPTLLSAKTPECGALSEAYTPIQERYERGLLFRLEKCGYPTSYMVGTMHSDSPQLLSIFTDATALIREVQAVGFEFVEDERTAATAMRYMYLPPNETSGLSGMLPEKQFQQLATELQKRLQLPPQATERLRPWAAAILLQYPRPTADGVVFDKRLQDAARNMGKNLLSLETPAEQFAIFAAIPQDKQMLMLRDTLDNLPELDVSNEEFLQAYAKRDLNDLQRLADKSFAMMTDKELRDYIEEKLLFARNRTMSNRMQPHLRRGNTLFAVGALHLMGEKGIFAYLEKEGWRVEAVR